ncbi:hypothetical protein GGS23DRAFT_593552 [Durotheca rogersii]|uniref:uncharacterized protein n=1 Tax=Durotheca rogersii TaxID=419775 RepID=UPI00221F6290|nr:uncharacterized protein GGS23DRAFT_593552 [Durotheca rogersii]KAI5866818.1 hypothetical protein GGS23DRAFT_593552 [Durotheca rogersii]
MTGDPAKRNSSTPRSSRLAESSYHSPYSRTGAPSPHPDTDPYAALRGRALSVLEAMGFEPSTMVEHGVHWAEHQDPYNHVMYSQYAHFLGSCIWRSIESYDEFLAEEEFDGMMKARTVIPVLGKQELALRRQVRYPDALISAYREDSVEPTRCVGESVLFSLKQQAVVAQGRCTVTYVDVRTGRPVDIRTLGGGFPALYHGLVQRSERAKALREKWERENPQPPRRGAAKM